MTTFWTDASLEPKRAYRFTCSIIGNSVNQFAGNANYFIKTVQKPGIEISSKEHMYLGHKFYYPGLVTWNPNPIEIKMVDPVSPDASGILAKILEASGYEIPSTPSMLRTISKNKAVTALGGIIISQLNDNGSPIETWELKNPYIKSVKFGDLDYSKEDLTEITLQVQYDWCQFAGALGDINSFVPKVG